MEGTKVDSNEFQVVDPGAPTLQEAAPQPTEQTQTVVVQQPAGWTAEEAAQVIGGNLATIIGIAYVFKWQAPPAAELWPLIAGDPKSEFPILGATIAPMLDFLAPKGTALGVGVGLSAGIGELVGAIGRRASVLNVPPPQKAQPQQAPAPPPPPGLVSEDEGGFKFRTQDLAVINQQDPYSQMGFAY